MFFPICNIGCKVVVVLNHMCLVWAQKPNGPSFLVSNDKELIKSCVTKNKNIAFKDNHTSIIPIPIRKCPSGRIHRNGLAVDMSLGTARYGVYYSFWERSTWNYTGVIKWERVGSPMKHATQINIYLTAKSW